MTVTKIKTRNPYDGLWLLTDNLKDQRRAKRFHDIWQDGYDSFVLGESRNPPWKNAPNRIVWGMGNFAARFDNEPGFAKTFRTIVRQHE